MKPFPTVSSTLPCTQTLLGLPILLPALGRVSGLSKSPSQALFLAFHPYLAARTGRSVQAGHGSRQGTWWMLLPTPSRLRQLRR